MLPYGNIRIRNAFYFDFFMVRTFQVSTISRQNFHIKIFIKYINPFVLKFYSML